MVSLIDNEPVAHANMVPPTLDKSPLLIWPKEEVGNVPLRSSQADAADYTRQTQTQYLESTIFSLASHMLYLMKYFTQQNQ